MLQWRGRVCWLWLSAVLVGLDAWSKQAAIQAAQWGRLELSSFLNIDLAFNRGMAFGWLSEHAGWQIVFLSVVALFAVGVLLFWLFSSERAGHLFQAGIACVIGGAMGNALDRVCHAAVTDFIDMHAFGWHFWTFNVADVAITVGVILLFLSSLVESSHRTTDHRL